MKGLFGLSIFVSALSASSVAAQTAGDVATGRQIVQQWCTNCHSVTAVATSDVAPSFPSIAEDRAKTEDYLRKWLLRPHPPMPDFGLAREDIDHIIAFIETLRAQPDTQPKR